MLKRYNGLIGIVYRLADLGVIVGAWLLAYWVRFYHSPVEIPSEQPPFHVYASVAPAVAVLWLVVFTTRGIYQSRRLVRLLREFQDLLHAHGIALLMFIALTYFLEQYKHSRLMMAYFAVIAGFALCASRAVVRTALRSLRSRGFNLRHLLVVGEGEAAQMVVNRATLFPELGLRVAGVVTHESSSTEHVQGAPVVGHFDQVRDVLETHKPDEVLIALSQAQHDKLERVLGLMQDETVDIRVVPDVQAYVTLGCEAEDFDGLPVVRINDSPLHGTSAMMKRAMDVLGSACALLLLSPLLMVLGALVKVTSPGPMLYAQERMGLDGKLFKMYKFRSMKVDAERTSGAVWAQAVDDRRTRLGTFLRKTSLDELPQFWNVLCGDMSLVGPRPERPVFVNQFRSEIPNYMLRHKVKAGITGWAQINGWRGNTSLVRRIECDLFYIRNWSLAFDIRILLLTFWKGFVHKNAY